MLLLKLVAQIFCVLPVICLVRLCPCLLISFSTESNCAQHYNTSSCDIRRFEFQTSLVDKTMYTHILENGWQFKLFWWFCLLKKQWSCPNYLLEGLWEIFYPTNKCGLIWDHGLGRQLQLEWLYSHTYTQRTNGSTGGEIERESFC